MKFLGLDLGERRVGVAVSDHSATIASPLVTLDAGPGLAAAVRRLMEEHQAAVVVVGVPHRLDGSVGPAAESALAFAGMLADSGLAVRLWDERLSTRQAERVLIAGGMSRRRRRQTTDRVAATLILQSFLDHQRATQLTKER
ncbi:MAG TPA: Holliday junction resolvase RuvX [Clostridiales bacterium UBA8153]|nr:Holliday junction resolvase RuvX [Clostridiales bacterium UBA8153]